MRATDRKRVAGGAVRGTPGPPAAPEHAPAPRHATEGVPRLARLPDPVVTRKGASARGGGAARRLGGPGPHRHFDTVIAALDPDGPPCRLRPAAPRAPDRPAAGG